MGDKTPSASVDEQRYRVLIDNAPEGVMIFDVDSNRFIEANQAAIDLLQFSREELLQLSISDINPPSQESETQSLDQARVYIQQALNGGNPSFEWVHMNRDGHEIPCEIRLIRFPPYDRSIVRASVIDLTDKKRIEQALAESEERLKVALKTAGLGCYDWYPQTNRVHWDAKMYDLFGLSPSDPINRSEFFFQCLHPEDRASIQQRFQDIMHPESKQLTFDAEYRIIRDGNIFHMVFTGVFIRAENGEVQRLIGTVQDVTERRQTELALRASEARYKSLVQHFPSGVIALFDQNLQYTLVDGERVNHLGLNLYSADIIGKGLRDLFPEDIYEKHESAQRAALAGEKSERTILMGDYYYAVSTLPVRDEQGNITSGLEVSQDITALIETEKKLNKTLEHLQLAIQTAKLGVWQYVFDKDELDCNNRLLEIYGVDPNSQGLSRKLWNEQIHPEDRDFVRQHMHELLQGAHLNELEFRIIIPSGEIRHIQASASPIFDKNGKLIELIGINVDLTNIRENEKALQESEELFHTVFDQQFQFMAILSPEGRVLEINDLPLRIIGAKYEDYIGALCWETPPWANLPDWQLKIKDQVTQACQRSEPLITEDVFMTIDGECRWVDAAYTPIRNDDHELRFILVQATDVTDRKLTERNLRKAQQELSELTNRFQISTRAAKLGTWDWQIEKDILIWDETMMGIYGITKDQFSGHLKDWKDYMIDEDKAVFQNMIDWISTGEKELNTEFRIKRPDGAIRYIKSVASVQQDEAGMTLGIIGANWDITQEKEAEQEQIRARQLELRNRELEQFAYVASHDLQEPLRTVISFVGLLKRGYKDQLDQRANDYIQFVVEASSRMSQLIKGLLEYSRIGTNRELSLIDVSALVQQILIDLSAQINSTQALIEVNQLPLIKGYETEMRMLFQNLISNAIKFRKTNQQPYIKIGVKEEKKMWVFSITDDGIGIAPMYKEQIFVLFQRLHGRVKYEGTGIGLAHCQKVVDLHGGTIWVESELNKGSTFFFSIPKSKKAFE